MLFTTEILKIYKLVNSVTKTQYRKKTSSNYKIIYDCPTFKGLKEKVLSLDVRDLMSTAETVDSRSLLRALLVFRSDIFDVFTEVKHLLTSRQAAMFD